MIRQWKNGILDNRLIFVVLLLLKVCWALDGESLDLPGKFINSNEISGVDGSIMEMEIGVSTDAETLQYYLTHWNESIAKGRNNSADEQSAVYYGEGLSDLFFQSSANNNSLILTDLSRCLKDFWITTCLKLLLLSRLDNILAYLKDNNLTRTDFSFMNGILTFKREQIREPGTNLHCKKKFGESGMIGLDEDITKKLMELFEDRTLRLNLLPGLAIDLISTPGKTPEDFIDFKAKPHFRWKFWQTDANREHRESSPRKKSKGGFRMPSMMMIPQLIMWGFMPFALANLQAMVMNAFMMNMMALNSAVFMTIRNLVFGPRGGPKIKYVNYGYRKKKNSNVPTLIIHSPAAFVKQPFHKSPLHSVGNEHFESQHKATQYSNPVRQSSVPQHYRDETPASYAGFDHSRASEEVSLNEPQNNQGALNDEYRITGYDNFESSDYNRRNVESDKGIQVMKMKGLLDGKKRFRIRLKSGSVRSMKELIRRIRAIEEFRKSNLSIEKSEKPRRRRKFGSRRTKITKGYRNRSNPIRNYLGNQNDVQEHDFSHPNDGYRIALDQSASHVSGERKLPETNTNYEVKNFAINYDRTDFKPMIINRDG